MEFLIAWATLTILGFLIFITKILMDIRDLLEQPSDIKERGMFDHLDENQQWRTRAERRPTYWRPSDLSDPQMGEGPYG